MNVAAPSRTSRREPWGFTLVEMAVSLAVMALLTGIAVLNLQGLRKNADLDTLVDQIVQLDRQARRQAESRGRAWQIVFDLDRQQMWSQSAETSVHSESDSESPRIYVPDHLRLEQMKATGYRSELSLIETGQTAVLVSARGASPTYGLRFRRIGGPDVPAADFTDLLVVGGSGQIHLDPHSSRETPFPHIFELLRPSRDDAG